MSGSSAAARSSGRGWDRSRCRCRPPLRAPRLRYEQRALLATRSSRPSPTPRRAPPPQPPAAAAMVDPMIKRIFVDPAVPLPPKSVRLASVLGLAAFLGATLYAKHVAPRALEAEVTRDMYSHKH